MRINISPDTFALYLHLVYGITPAEMEKKLVWKDFLKIYTAMMCSQPQVRPTQLYRINLVAPNSKVDYVALIKANRADAQAIFEEFDYEKQGVVEKSQMPTLLLCAGCADIHGDQFAALLATLPVVPTQGEAASFDEFSRLYNLCVDAEG